jgi:hypothetical protein
MNKKEPTKYSMSTGLPVSKNDEVKKYPMDDDNEGSAEQSFLNFIQKAKESKKKYNLWLEEKESKDST